MNYQQRGSRVVLLAVLLFSLAFSLQPLYRAHAAGDLSIQQGLPLVDPGTTTTIDVSVSGMDYFNGWDIAVWTNTTALNATAIDTSTSNVFGSGYNFVPGTSCINNNGKNCDSTVDGPGVAHFSAVVIPPPPTTNAPFSGVLFSITYKAGAYSYSPLQFRLSRIINGGCTPCPDVDHTTEDGSYGTTTAPNISLTVSDQFPSVTKGRSVNTTITVSSINDFSGQVNFAYHSLTALKGIQVNFNSTSVFLNNSTASDTITFTTGNSTNVQVYSFNFTASAPRIFQYAIINLNVQEPGDFQISINPSLIRIPQNSTTTAIVTLSSGTRTNVSEEFSGNVTLSVVARNATATLGQTTLFVSPGRSSSTSLTIWVPPSFYGFTYLINVTGMWTLSHDLNTTAQVVVTHLPSDLTLTVSPNTLTIVAGHSAYGVLTIKSANYFVGYAYPSSTMSGGTARFNETTVRVDNGETVSVSVNVTIDAKTGSGNYLVLLSATGQLASGVAFVHSAPENIIVKSNGENHLVAQLPTTILGLPIPVYFGILGGFTAILVLLSALVYRKSKSDKDEWD